jgi:hypothetical protein
MCSIRLPLNTTKTEILWCTTARRQYLLRTSRVRIGPNYAIPSSSIRALGIYVDADVSMSTHMIQTVFRCFGAFYQLLRTIRLSVPTDIFKTLVVWLFLTRLDYVNATLAELLAYRIHQLQAMTNTRARLIFLH